MSGINGTMTNGVFNKEMEGGTGVDRPGTNFSNSSHLPQSSIAQSSRVPAFGGDFQPGFHAPSHRKFANPGPLGLSAFALTTFILSLINMNTLHLSAGNIVVSSAYAYGGLVQLLAGMWEMAVGNTFGATALSSYGGFWIAIAIIDTPAFAIPAAYESASAFNNAFGLFLIAWWIFTTILLLCTLRSTLSFFLLFFFLDIAFLMLAVSRLQQTDGVINSRVNNAGGFFGLLAAFLAWYNAFAGMIDSTNSFFLVPVGHFPWSEAGRNREKTVRETV
ncbi:MAG: hypothetical protein M1829_000063 [Trizodia sp. TS-e1964]|nr:MAG: hypothetical protein M1829_000063 [Trizodia sp. TS-e1964]